ncbi:MAG TPA: PilZ domain-containing protein [Nitrospirota bacterium]|nr:PilZ domain-containing protein [Nitrospirota bacterium]
MKKIIIMDKIKRPLELETNFLERPDIKIFTAYSNEEVLKIHGDEKVDLIITLINIPGMGTGDLCSVIRAIKTLRRVSIIVYSPDDEKNIAMSERCRANAVMTLPVNAALLLDKVQELLHISSRESCRVLIIVRREGHLLSRPFTCSSENISATGMLVETHKNLERGDRIECSFIMPDSTRMETRGEIVRVVKNSTRCHNNWYGVKFASLPLEAKCAIEAFVGRKTVLRPKYRDS